jgi:pimeloyl-ACP methyl ester carboxylesterase
MKKKDNTPAALKIVRWLFPKAERLLPSLAHRYFVRIFFTPLRYPTPDKERKAETFAEKFSLTVEGKHVQGYVWGDAVPYILLVHGWAGRSTQFRRFVKPLQAAGYRVIGFDAPAHGNSSGKKTSILEFETVLKNIFERYGEPHAILAHSFGGGAVLFAAMNGLPVKKLINIASPTIGDEILNSFLRAVNGSQSTGQYFKEYMIKTYGKPFHEFTALHFVKHLPIAINLLMIYDSKDWEVKPIHGEELLKAYPSATLIRTEGLGHTRILKDDEVIRQVVTFVGPAASGQRR